MLNPKLSKLKRAGKLKTLKQGISPQIQRAISVPQRAKELKNVSTQDQNIENIKRVMAQSKEEQGSSSDTDSKAKDDDKGTWKIVIGVGLGIGLVTAIGYYALKE